MLHSKSAKGHQQLAYKDPEKKKQAIAKWKKDNPEKVKACRIRHAAKAAKRSAVWRANNPEKAKRLHVHSQQVSNLKRSGWTPEMLETTRYEQGNACAICRKPFTKTPHADHRHVSPPEPRGLLCGNCNLGLGQFLDNSETLRDAADYLESWDKCQ